MFDIRLVPYRSAEDTARDDFWSGHDHVVASLQTLRKDARGRHERIFEADPWDLVLVDEAHHLGADEAGGQTLGYRLVRRLVDEERVRSMVFFTATPHRGKDFGFLALLRLLRPNLFDPAQPVGGQLRHLPKVMIRNNKQNVTDLRGKRLFQSPVVSNRTYVWSEAEARFYAKLTEFIATGKAYASGLSDTEGRAVMLVLIAMQKLAASSVAAIRRALVGRRGRLRGDARKMEDVVRKLEAFQDAREITNLDELADLEAKLVKLQRSVDLMEHEEEAIAELIRSADEVTRETKIDELLGLLEDEVEGGSVLVFTEYKATQSLIMSALIRRFGPDSVTFINGEGKARDIVGGDGRVCTLYADRDEAADRFNRQGDRRPGDLGTADSRVSAG